MPSIDRQTVITFPLNNNRTDITTGIEAGSLYLNKILFEKQINFGEAHCDRFEVTLFGVDDLSGETIQVYQLDYSEDEDNPTLYDLFYGVVDSCKRENNNANRRLVAYDLMYTIGNTDATDWWNTYWSDKVESTISALFSSLVTNFNINVASTVSTLLSTLPNNALSILQFSGIQSITVGTVLSYICQPLLCFPHFNNMGELELVTLLSSGVSTLSSDEYEDENSTFEEYETEAVSRVVIYGETDVIAGEYGTGDNVYVIKNNPLLYNLTEATYTSVAQTIYNSLNASGTQLNRVNYTPSNIKMVVSKPDLQLGTFVRTVHPTTGNDVTLDSVISSMEISGSMFVEQTLISSGNQKLTPDDFNITDGKLTSVNETANEALEQATTTSRHFVWVPNVGAFVTTDNTPAGQVPTSNYTKLTEDGLYVAVDGKEVAHFGVDENDDPISILGSTDAGESSVIISSEGLVVGKTIWTDYKRTYFSINTPPQSDIYTKETNLSLTVSSGQGYLQLIRDLNYKSIASVQYNLSANIKSGDMYLDLSKTRSYYDSIDIVISAFLDFVFEGLSSTSVTIDSPLTDWFDLWFSANEISTNNQYVSIYYSIMDSIRIDGYFFNTSGNAVPYHQTNYARYIKIASIVTSGSNGLAITKRRYLTTTEYSYNSSDFRVNISNYTLYNLTSPRNIVTSGSSSIYILNVTNTIDWTVLILETENVSYQATLGQSANDNSGIDSIALGDYNTVTNDSQLGAIVAGYGNTVDNNRLSGSEPGVYVIGKSNTVEHPNAYVIGLHNQLTGKPTTHTYDGISNVVIGVENTVENTNNYSGSGYNTIIGNHNEADGYYNSAFGTFNNVAGEFLVAIGRQNEISGENAYAFGTANEVTSNDAVVIGNLLQTNSYNSGEVVIGNLNDSNYDSSSALVVGNGYNNDARHNAMEVGNGVTLYPLQNNALIFDNGGVDRNVNIRYQNDAGGAAVNFIQVIPTGGSYGATLGLGAGNLTVVGGGECVSAIANDPTLIGLTTSSENAVVCSDANVNFISNANTIANFKVMTFQNTGILKINACAGTGNKLAYFDSTGQLQRDTRYFYAKGDSFTISFNGLGGHVTNGAKDIVVYIPFPFAPSYPNTSTLTLGVGLRAITGTTAYPYMYNSTTSIGTASGYTTLVNSGTKISGLSGFDFADFSNAGFRLRLQFSNMIQKTASATSNQLENNAPVSVSLSMSGTFST